MKTWFGLVAIAIVSLLSFCCKEEPEILNPIPVPGQPGHGQEPIIDITDEQRLAVLDECKKVVDQLGDLKSEAAQQLLVQWLKSRPEFEEAGILGANVWAYFYDGRVAMIVPDWEEREVDGGRIKTSETGERKIQPGIARISDIPQSDAATLFSGLGKAFIDYRPQIKDLFLSSRTKYKVDLKDATIENLMAVKDLGIFYIHTHGGLGFLKPRSANRGTFGLWTKDTITLESEKTWERELNSDMLLYMNAVHDDSQKTEWHYAIASDFVQYYHFMNFADNAIFYVDACNGMSGMAERFRQTMINKAANDMGTYIGWTAPTSREAGGPAANFVFDRLLGAHNTSVPTEEPIQRPFDWSSIFEDLQSYDFAKSRHGGSLASHSTGTSEVILTPSIEYITMNDYQSIMIIKGMFGENTKNDGKVTVDGIPAQVTVWSPDFIYCEIPDRGPGSVGNVVVSVRGNESNPVPLSEWAIPLHVTLDQYGVKLDASLTVVVRADVHRYRSKAGEVPKMERPDSLGTVDDNSLGYAVSRKSTGNYSVKGERLASCTFSDCTLRDKETAVANSGLLPNLLLAESLGFSAYYKWTPDMRQLHINLAINIPNVGIESEMYTACPDAEPLTTALSYAAPMGVTIPSYIKTLVLNLDHNHHIEPDKKEYHDSGKWGRCAQDIYINTSVSWPAVTPLAPPGQNTESRMPFGN